jgi:hypothetical protein
MDPMDRPALLVGSVPLASAEAVFRLIGPSLGKHLPAIPDGEIGARRWWVARLHQQVYSRHPDIDTLQRPLASELDAAQLLRKGRGRPWQFRIRAGVKQLRFPEGLGYTQSALESYAVFCRLRDEGVIPAGVRFQVSLPLPNSAASPAVIVIEDIARFREALRVALRAEANAIAQAIPHEDLAIQWDGSWEITDVYDAVPGLRAEGAMERNVAQVRELSLDLPATVMLGYHLCFGTFGGWPRLSPNDLGRAVQYANRIIAESGRPVDWIHVPALDRTDPSFYAPLAQLQTHGARVYLGLVHSMESFGARLAAARRFLPEFGVAAYCGFGRIDPAQMPAIIEDHLAAIAALG